MEENKLDTVEFVDTSVVKMETQSSNHDEESVDMKTVKIESDSDDDSRAADSVKSSFTDMKFVNSDSVTVKNDNSNTVDNAEDKKYEGVATAQLAMAPKINSQIRTYVITNIQPVTTNYQSVITNIQPITSNVPPVRNIQPVITNVQSIASVPSINRENSNKFSIYSKGRNIGTQVNFNLVSLLQNRAKKQKTKLTQTLPMKKIAKAMSTQTLLTAKPCTVGSYIQVNAAPFTNSLTVPEFGNQDISNNALRPLKIKLKGKNVGTQCLLGECYIKRTKETMSQTWPPWSPPNKLPVNNIVKILTNPLENEIMNNSSEGCKVLQKIVEECRSKHLNVKFLKNSRYEKMISVSQSSFVGLMEEDLEIVEVQFSENGKCTINIPFRETQVKQFFVAMPGQEAMFLGNLEETVDMLVGKEYSYCPGMKANVEFADGQHYEKFTIPYPRVQSVFCQVWYKSGKKGMKVQCEHCRKATTTLYIVKQRKGKETPEQAAKRTKIDSNYPIKNLTKDQLQVRYESVNQARKSLAQRLAKVEAQLLHKDALLKQFAEESVQNKSVSESTSDNNTADPKLVTENDIVQETIADNSKMTAKPIVDDDIIQESIATDTSDTDFMDL